MLNCKFNMVVIHNGVMYDDELLYMLLKSYSFS